MKRIFKFFVLILPFIFIWVLVFLTNFMLGEKSNIVKHLKLIKLKMSPIS